MKYIDLAKKVATEMSHDKNVLAVLLYGSVARGHDNTNSDIDLLVLTQSYQLQKRQAYRGEVRIEFLEIHEDFLKDFIEKEEVPILRALSEGIVLAGCEPKMKDYMSMARERLDASPKNEKLDSLDYQTYSRSILTEAYKDLLEADTLVFNYMSSNLVTSLIPLLYHQSGQWLKNSRQLLPYLKTFRPDAYGLIASLLDQSHSLTDRISSAEKLVLLALEPYGGMLDCDCIIFRKTNLVQ